MCNGKARRPQALPPDCSLLTTKGRVRNQSSIGKHVSTSNGGRASDCRCVVAGKHRHLSASGRMIEKLKGKSKLDKERCRVNEGEMRHMVNWNKTENRRNHAQNV